MAYTRENFDDWVFFINDKMDYFTGPFAKEHMLNLDFSIESLDTLEQWLMNHYATSKHLIEDNGGSIWECCGIYVGEVFRRYIGGKWHIITDDPKDVFYMMPVLTDEVYPGTTYKPPLLYASACINRKRGNYISTVLRNNIRHKQAD